MKRLFVLAFCAFGIAYAVTACGGGSDDVATTTSDDKLTIVGAGS